MRCPVLIAALALSAAASAQDAKPEPGWNRLWAKPLQTRVSEIGETTLLPEEKAYHNRQTLCTIDAGSEKGVFEGMKLYLVSTRVAGSIVVRKVEKEKATILVRAKPDQAMPEEGWLLASRPKGN